MGPRSNMGCLHEAPYVIGDWLVLGGGHVLEAPPPPSLPHHHHHPQTTRHTYTTTHKHIPHTPPPHAH